MLIEKFRAILAGRPALVQYRSKLADRALRTEQALLLKGMCRDAGVPFVVNDDLQMALSLEADGVHLGKGDGDIAEARQQLGPGRIVGASCYDSWSSAVEAVKAGADYVAFGALFPSRVKPEAVAAPLNLLTQAQRELGVTVVGIGGITLDNAPSAIAAGADMLAVISDVFNTQNPERQANHYRILFEKT